MKKFLFALLFLLLGALIASSGIFAVAKIQENQAKSAAGDTDTDVEDDTTDLETTEGAPLVVFDEGYYSVYYQQCDITFPFPEAVNFSYLDTNSDDHVESGLDNDRGWYLQDRLVDPTQTMFFDHFERMVQVSISGLPYREIPGSGYVPALVEVQCYADTTETLDAAFARIQAEVDAIPGSEDELIGEEPFAIESIVETTYNDLPAISFEITGGFFGASSYTLVRNDTHVFVIQDIVLSEDEQIQDAAAYIRANINI